MVEIIVGIVLLVVALVLMVARAIRQSWTARSDILDAIQREDEDEEERGR